MTNGLPQAPAGAILANGITAPPCRRLTSMPADPTTSRPADPDRQTGRGKESVVLKKLSPEAPGAKRLAARYGAALLCVRYREDSQSGKRLTTVELIVDQRPLPTPVSVRIAFDETELRRQV